MLLSHQVCHFSKIYLLIDGLKLENEILKEVGSNESDVLLAYLSRGCTYESNNISMSTKLVFKLMLRQYFI